MSHYDGFYHYLPISDMAMKSGVYLTGAGREMTHPDSKYPPTGHPALYQFEWARGRILPEFALILITDGKGEFESRVTGRQMIQDDTIILLVPELWHRYRPERTSGWTERWISFNGEMVHRFCSIGILGSILNTLSGANLPQLIHEFDALLEQVHANPVSNSVHLSMKVMSLVTLALEPFSKQTDSPISKNENAIVQNALQIIWTRSHYPLSVEKLAKELSIPRRTLDRHFSASRGRSVLDEINFCRITRAKRLLSETDLPIKLVTYLAGFTSIERMRVAFIASEKVPPSKFREIAKSVRARNTLKYH